MNYDEITKITAERISDYMTEAVNTDSKVIAEMFHNAAWGVRTLWFELCVNSQRYCNYLRISKGRLHYANAASDGWLS
ncbi:hypothetical protein [Salmonella enterica]|uniref:Uncharacterized protein n=1 Tax=Salmonella enterica TaxID=28901 RepID=A0A622U0C9_SALER|nr:hypothetical protein [Salmonella enterica]ECF7365011.1 hypothetical protein [Salmonella enterica subsp. enterica]ECS6214843.1 hypothetical protein [Salmonella enterica subsp. enterica serovar Lomalinda]EAM7959048.1 hypothetical protein [Salmonella enterica]EAO7763436.1 hypothetical protein [Salmonella enterica]